MAAPPTTLPCSQWTSEEEIRACCPGLSVSMTGPALDQVIAYVSSLLYRLSGRQFPGECERIVWPCAAESNGGCCGGAFYNNWWWGYGDYPAYPFPNGSGTGFVNIGRCVQRCRLNRVKLPSTINSVNEVIIDGEVLDPTAYKIEAYRWLARVDGGRWPCFNRLDGEPGDDGVWTIDYNYGKPVPLDGRYVASILACEMAKNRCGADNCLPARLKSLSRQGIEMAFADPLEFIDDGQVGIYEVDMWLRSVNPHKLKRRARVHRADRGPTNTTFTG